MIVIFGYISHMHINQRKHYGIDLVHLAVAICANRILAISSSPTAP